jgi:3',5'-cyclic AMP phosphodiesterase CpdA
MKAKDAVKPQQNSHLTRRTLIGSSLLAAAVGTHLTAGGSEAKAASIQGTNKKRVVRFAHLTDIHLEPKRKAPEGLAAALRHIQALTDQPEMIITGGDNVMCVLGADDNWASVQFSLVKEIFKKECRLPVKFCIGNHDVWGWDRKSGKTTGDEPLWGKKRPVQEFGLPGRYYAFDQGPWRIVMLDSTHSSEDVYTAKLDEEQYAWLVEELAAHRNQYICIVSHIPIFSAAVLLDGENEKTGQWIIPHQWMHLDARKLIDLFVGNKNVKLCISGHLHLLERVEYNHVVYLCDGAVCGAWWGGAFHQCPAGYGVFDLYEDGTFDHEYIDYGWIPEPA